MPKVLVTEAHLQDIANAIRQKTGTISPLRPGDMADAIADIDTGYPEPTGTLAITANGTVNVKDYASANVNVQPSLQSKTVTENGTVTPDTGYDGLSSVVVNVQGGGQSGGEHLIPSNPGAEIINNVGVIISSNALGANGIDISGYEYSAGYEGMNVVMRDLTIGQEYDVTFDFQSTDAGFFSGQYTIGYKVSATSVSSYPTGSTPDSSYTAFTRDLTVNTCSTRFTATASTMYIIFAFVGYSDSRTNYFTISKLKVTEVSA